MMVQHLPKEKYLMGFVTLGNRLSNKLTKLALLAATFNEFHWLTASGTMTFRMKIIFTSKY